MREEMPTKPIPLRLPEEMLKRIDAYAERVRHEHHGLAVNRADLIRMLITYALDDIEGKKPKKK